MYCQCVTGQNAVSVSHTVFCQWWQIDTSTSHCRYCQCVQVLSVYDRTDWPVNTMHCYCCQCVTGHIGLSAPNTVSAVSVWQEDRFACQHLPLSVLSVCDGTDWLVSTSHCQCCQCVTGQVGLSVPPTVSALTGGKRSPAVFRLLLGTYSGWTGGDFCWVGLFSSPCLCNQLLVQRCQVTE